MSKPRLLDLFAGAGGADPDEDWHAELDSALKKMRSEP